MNCHNNADTLYEALQSVYEQSFANWEIIFWDNYSKDNSFHIANDYARNIASHGKQMHCFRADKHTTLGQARNAALMQSKGEYIAFLDCDDIWLPSKLSKQVALMDANDKLALVCTNTENFYANKSLNNIFDTAKPQRGKVYAELIRTQWIAMSAAMLRRSSLNKLRDAGPYFDESLSLCEEAELFYALAYAFELDYVDEVLTRRRIHKKNTTFTQWASLALETEYILQKQYILHKNFAHNYADIILLWQRRIIFQHAVSLWRDGQGQCARKKLRTNNKLSTKESLFYLLSFLPPIIFPYALRIYLKFAKLIHNR